jgi:hypothetical protein
MTKRNNEELIPDLTKKDRKSMEEKSRCCNVCYTTASCTYAITRRASRLPSSSSSQCWYGNIATFKTRGITTLD